MLTSIFALSFLESSICSDPSENTNLSGQSQSSLNQESPLSFQGSASRKQKSSTTCKGQFSCRNKSYGGCNNPGCTRNKDSAVSRNKSKREVSSQLDAHFTSSSNETVQFPVLNIDQFSEKKNIQFPVQNLTNETLKIEDKS